jgi:hypothetical protein
MPAAYNELLDATILHLEKLKSRGVRNVAVAPETLRALAQPPAKSQISNFKSAIQSAAPVPAKLKPPFPCPQRKLNAASSGCCAKI